VDFRPNALTKATIDSGLLSTSIGCTTASPCLWAVERLKKEIFGESEVTAGASGDIRAVADLAREMVTCYGDALIWV
jgi:cell division protease FtsH